MPTNLTPSKPPLLILGTRGGEPMRVLRPGTKHRIERRMVDVCFVFDTTGSMSDKIDGLTECMVDFVAELSQLSLDWRATAVPFGDLTEPGDTIETDLPFVADRQAAERMLRELRRNSGGGNEGESSLEAVRAALAKPYRQGAVKVFVILTDEPALHHQVKATAIEKSLRDAEVIAFVASPPLAYFRRWAEVTGGRWYEIGAYFDRSAIIAFLRALVREVAQVASAVHTLAGGSVSSYLQLPPDRRGIERSGPGR